MIKDKRTKTYPFQTVLRYIIILSPADKMLLVRVSAHFENTSYARHKTPPLQMHVDDEFSRTALMIVEPAHHMLVGYVWKRFVGWFSDHQGITDFVRLAPHSCAATERYVLERVPTSTTYM